jgi:hypothetical protein
VQLAVAGLCWVETALENCRPQIQCSLVVAAGTQAGGVVRASPKSWALMPVPCPGCGRWLGIQLELQNLLLSHRPPLNVTSTRSFRIRFWAKA